MTPAVWRRTTFGPALLLLALLGCTGHVDLTAQHGQAVDRAWCTAGLPSVPTKGYGGQTPDSRADACMMTARKLADTDVAGRLVLEQKACDLDNENCLLFVEDVDRRLNDETSRASVPGALIEAAYRLCADDKARYRQGINATPSICHTDAHIATMLNNSDFSPDPDATPRPALETTRNPAPSGADANEMVDDLTRSGDNN